MIVRYGAVNSPHLPIRITSKTPFGSRGDPNDEITLHTPEALQAQVTKSCRSTTTAISNTSFTQLQKRTFLDSILKSGLGDCPLRNLSHTKVIPYSSHAVFKAVADVSGYPTFLPFTISSHVLTRDNDGYPTKAKLKIGYEKFGLEENWNSVVKCDPGHGTIEAKSSEQGSHGLFEVLETKWQIRDNGKQNALVKLDVDVKFRNAVYDQMFAQVEGKVAATMISAFEKRIQELEAGR